MCSAATLQNVAFTKRVLTRPDIFDAIDVHCFAYYHFEPDYVDAAFQWVVGQMQQRGYQRPMYSLEWTGANMLPVTFEGYSDEFRDYFPYSANFPSSAAFQAMYVALDQPGNLTYRLWFEAEQAKEFAKIFSNMLALGVSRLVHVQYSDYYAAAPWYNTFWNWQGIIKYVGGLFDEDAVERIEQLGIDEVKVRTPLTCDTRYGICGKCYGRDLGRGALVNVGKAVGVIAAQSIGEPGTQLTMRTFHIGGAASRTAVVSQVESKSAGTVRYSAAMRYVTNARGELVAISRNGEALIHDDAGRERERHKVPYGAMLLTRDGEAVKAGQVLATWDPHTRPIITEYAGRVKFENVEEGVTVAKQTDEVTGLSTGYLV